MSPFNYTWFRRFVSFLLMMKGGVKFLRYVFWNWYLMCIKIFWRNICRIVFQFNLLSENKLIICAFGNLHYQISREKFGPEPGFESPFRFEFFSWGLIIVLWCFFFLSEDFLNNLSFLWISFHLFFVVIKCCVWVHLTKLKVNYTLICLKYPLLHHASPSHPWTLLSFV